VRSQNYRSGPAEFDRLDDAESLLHREVRADTRLCTEWVGQVADSLVRSDFQF